MIIIITHREGIWEESTLRKVGEERKRL